MAANYDLTFDANLTAPTIALVSSDPSGNGGDNNSSAPALSDDGTVAGFTSLADDLSLLRRGLQLHHGRLRRRLRRFVRGLRRDPASVKAQGVTFAADDSPNPNSAVISDDGSTVAFTSTQAINLSDNAIPNFYYYSYYYYQPDNVFARTFGPTPSDVVLVSVKGFNAGSPITGTGGDNSSQDPSISADGRYVAFDSYSSGLTAADTSNGYSEVYVRDIQGGTTSLISTNVDDSTNGPAYGYSSNPSISNDGSTVAFQSSATDLVSGFAYDYGYNQIYTRDAQAATPRPWSATTRPAPRWGIIIRTARRSAGRATSSRSTRRRTTSPTCRTRRHLRRVLGRPGRRHGGPALEGRPGLILRDLGDGLGLVDQRRRVEGRLPVQRRRPGTEQSSRYQQAYVYDDSTQTLGFASSPDGTTAGNGYTYNVVISGQGNAVAFETYAGNLVPGQTSGYDAVYVRTLGASPATVAVSVHASDGTLTYGNQPSISDDGNIVAFGSYDPNLVSTPSYSNYNYQVFAADLPAGDDPTGVDLVRRIIRCRRQQQRRDRFGRRLDRGLPERRDGPGRRAGRFQQLRQRLPPGPCRPPRPTWPA